MTPPSPTATYITAQPHFPLNQCPLSYQLPYLCGLPQLPRPILIKWGHIKLTCFVSKQFNFQTDTVLTSFKTYDFQRDMYMLKKISYKYKHINSYPLEHSDKKTTKLPGCQNREFDGNKWRCRSGEFFRQYKQADGLFPQFWNKLLGRFV